MNGPKPALAILSEHISKLDLRTLLALLENYQKMDNAMAEKVVSHVEDVIGWVANKVGHVQDKATTVGGNGRYLVYCPKYL